MKYSSHSSIKWARNRLGKIVAKNASIVTVIRELKLLTKQIRTQKPALSGLGNLDAGILKKDGYSSAWADYHDKKRLRANTDLGQVKRAKKDKDFRQKLITALKPKRARTQKDVEAYEKNFGIRQMALHTLTKIGYSKVNPTLQSNVAKLYISANTAEDIGIKVVKRGSDWHVTAAIKSYFYHRDSVTTWKNGKAVSYCRAANITYIRSFGIILSDKRAIFYIADKKLEVALPEGIKWGIDSNGIKINKGKDDFHPTAREILSANPVEAMTGELVRNSEIRKKNELELAVELADSEGVFVCAKDSLRAGNCLQGTIQFANNNGINVRRHYSAVELLSLAIKSDFQRFKLVIKVACNRWKREMERGYSLVEDHALPTHS